MFWILIALSSWLLSWKSSIRGFVAFFDGMVGTDRVFSMVVELLVDFRPFAAMMPCSMVFLTLIARSSWLLSNQSSVCGRLYLFDHVFGTDSGLSLLVGPLVEHLRLCYVVRWCM